MNLVYRTRDADLWLVTCGFDHNDPGQIRYKYRLFSEGNVSNVPFFGQFLSTGPSDCCEVCERNVKPSSLVFDAFHFPDDKRHYTETFPQSVYFYIQWLFNQVNDTNIKELLIQTENLNFRALLTKPAKQMVDWILQQAVSHSVTDVQRLYSCVIIGHIASICFTYTPFSLPENDKTKASLDRFLQCFDACVNRDLLPSSSLKTLEKIAPVLVESCSSPGWLTLAAHFYPYLGVKYLTKQRMVIQECDKKEYVNLVHLLLSHLTTGKDEDNKSAYRRLLTRVLRTAPDMNAVLDLFENADLSVFFDSDTDKEAFFVDFYQDSQHGGEKTPNPGKKLHELLKIPDKLLSKMPGLVQSSLLEFAKLADEPKEKHAEAFRQLITSNRHLSSDQTFSILKELSKSRSTTLQNLLLRLLNDKMFDWYWQGISLSQKVAICSSWLTTRVVSEKRKHGNMERTKTVYEATQDLMSCSLNISNKALAEELNATVIEKLLKDEEAVSILSAFSHIEKFSHVVQECYKNHVKVVLQRNPRLVKNSSQTLIQYSLSRYDTTLNRFTKIMSADISKTVTCNVRLFTNGYLNLDLCFLG